MAERYRRLYELPGGCCAAGAPVLIRSGALLEDTRSRNLLVQLKFYNLSPETVVGLTVRLDFPSQPGQPLLRSYSRLKAGEAEEFGQDTALMVPDRSVRSFRAGVIAVDFADGTRWKDRNAQWEEMPPVQTLAAAYGPQLAQQYRVRYGTDCVYVPFAFGDFWQCTCGAVNRSSSASCRRCHRLGKAYLNINLDSLRDECGESMEEEDCGEEDKGSAEMRAESGELRRILPLALLGLFLIAVIIFATPRVLNAIMTIPVASPAPGVESPVPSDPSEELPVETVPIQTEPPTFTPEQLKAQSYENAMQLLEEERYNEARAAFLKLGGFRDSETMANEAVYRKAEGLLQFIRDYDEQDIYALLSLEARGTNRFSMASEKALELGSQAVSALRSACGGDRVDVTFTENPSGTLRPLAACVKDLYLLLDGYQDSEKRLEELETLTDYTKDFYMLCEAGDIDGAYTWLERYHGVFNGKDHWLQLLALYKPFCGDWGPDHAGDPTLLPMTLQHDVVCTRFNSRVLIQGDRATLRLRFTEGEEEYYVDLSTDTGATNFLYNLHGIYYIGAINVSGNFGYYKYYDDALQGSVEYARAPGGES